MRLHRDCFQSSDWKPLKDVAILDYNFKPVRSLRAIHPPKQMPGAVYLN